MLQQTAATLLLIGFPNAGKSTFFNLLTGGNRKVSNYSGVTVDMGRADIKSDSDGGIKLKLVDLPGIYNLVPASLDEGVTVKALLNLEGKDGAQKVLMLLDWQRIEASMSLALAVKDIVGSDNIAIVINKDDSAEIDPARRSELEKKLGCRVLPLSALNASPKTVEAFIRGLDLSSQVEPVKKLQITKEAMEFLPAGDHSTRIEVIEETKTITDLINWYHQKARDVLGSLSRPNDEKSRLTQKIDRIVLNPWLGGIIFAAIFYFIFDAIYTWAGPAMDLAEGVVVGMGDFVGNYLPEGHFKSLIVDGIFGGVGGVVVFLPQIMALFFLLSLLEQSGYVARAAVVTDRIMGIFGLNGKAFLPYMSGFACAIPGIMATRTIPNPRERYATLMTLPLITCSARLPVYILLIGTFVPATTVLGIFNAQTLSFFFLYFLGSIAALVIAKILRLSYFKGETGNFIIDLPLYQRPSIKTAFIQSWKKGKTFLTKAGTIILGLSILIWLLSTFPSANPELLEGKTPEQQAGISLEQSMLGTMGRTIEPVIKPIGMDWKIGVGMLVAFGARELFVSAMGTIYSLGDVDEESSPLREKLMAETWSDTGAPVFTLATAWAILIFFVFSLQCTSTLAILRRETGGWKIPIIMFTYMGLLAYGGAYIAYNLLS
tara:strand:+ start:17772 stop:19751 length:1980 start_codon:yes stop_codon:yes gene_type:complete